jgi:transposase InsO family protein
VKRHRLTRRVSCWRAELRARVTAWIEEYNRARRHSALGMRSPIDYERALREHPPEAA